MTKSLISIIVPIYNVEPYLRQCLDSIVSQTYINLEIILVNDGSTDNCPQICNNYAVKDKRIKVIHKENGGLSDARNAGLDLAKGDFIYFIDGDDYLGTEVISCLHDYIENNNNIAIAIGYFTAIYENKYKTYRNDWIFNQSRLIEPNDFANRMLMEMSNFAATAKLYRKELFENIRFRKNVKNEDSLFIADLIPVIEKNSYRCVDIPNYSYYYIQRAQSICNDDNDPLEKYVIENYDTIIQKFSNRPTLTSYLKRKQFDLSIDLQKKLLKSGNLNEYERNIKRIRKIPIIHVIKRKSIRLLLLFLILKYTPKFPEVFKR